MNYNPFVGQDLPSILWWWLVVAGVGLSVWPVVRIIFKSWFDRGYFATKAAGIGVVTFGVWIISSWKLAEFGQQLIWVVLAALAILSWWKIKKSKEEIDWAVVLKEELFFGAALIFWSWVKAYEPTINGLEKFMDYGFTQSIMKTRFFPPGDMWFSGESINYYYFGHLAMAVLTKISNLQLAYTFNLMLTTLFALCLTMSFGIGYQLLAKSSRKVKLWGAALIAFLVTLGGNLQTIYALTSGYNGEETPPPFWEIKFDPNGWKNYWYPNATRFIPYTIHEFPSYSFVVSDVHGHVLDIPFLLLAIALLINMFGVNNEDKTWHQRAIFGWVAGIMFMTSALDGPIYMALFVLMYVFFSNPKLSINRAWIEQAAKDVGLAIVVFVITVLPFMLSFKPFVSGVAVNCPPESLANSKIGPLVFEEVEKCQRSPVWMMLVLWGLFLWGGIWYVFARDKNPVTKKMFYLWSAFCLGLILFAEFFYFKDIYPLHFRSNTMFKLGYQVFILMSIVTGYTIVKYFEYQEKKLKFAFWVGVIPMLVLVSIYPWFSVRSYFGGLKTYQGLYGLKWLDERYPNTRAAIDWFKKNVDDRDQPVIVEASGDSYTDFDAISTFSGLPTVAGLVVHEWLWRGSYDPIAKRGEEVRGIYESEDVEKSREVLSKYNVKYIVVGDFERQKYPLLNESSIEKLGEEVFVSGTTKIYKVS